MTITPVLQLTALSLRVCSTAMGYGGLGHQNGYRFDREPGRVGAASRGRPIDPVAFATGLERRTVRCVTGRIAYVVPRVLTLWPTRRGLRRLCIRSAVRSRFIAAGWGVLGAVGAPRMSRS